MNDLTTEEARERFRNEKEKLLELLDTADDERFSRVFNTVYEAVYPSEVRTKDPRRPEPTDPESHLMNSATKEEFIQRYKELNPDVSNLMGENFQNSYVKWFKKKLTGK